MPACARVSDATTGICDLKLPCCPHARSGTNSVGSPNVFINGKLAHRLNDSGPTNCPHGGTFNSVVGSSNVIVNGQPLTRIGDTTQCIVCGQSGSHVSGSPDVFAGG
jgi:uncharacterized Zn-binding protein involved in type VI secretion